MNRNNESEHGSDHNACDQGIPNDGREEKDSQGLTNIVPPINCNKELSLWKMRNLPDKMNTLGVIRFITNLGVVAEEKRSLYQVLTIKNYETNKGMKVEAILQMTEEMGRRLLSHNGLQLEDGQVEISRTRNCKFGNKCVNIGKSCLYYHEKYADSLIQNRTTNPLEKQPDQLKPLCWFQNSCPFGTKCKFSHPIKATQQASQEQSNHQNKIQQVKN